MYPLDFWTALPIFLAAPAQIAFMLIYSLPAFGAGEWWKSFIGRALFIKSGTITFLILVSVSSYIIHYYHHFYTGVNYAFVPTYGLKSNALITVGYWLVCLAIYYQIAALLRQRFISQRNSDG